jgi:hypothetical protein
MSTCSESRQASNQKTASGWKTFSNRAGWSIDYPPDWRVSSCKNCSDPADPNVFVDFFPPDSDQGWLMIDHLMDKPKSMSVDGWFKKMEQMANPNPIIHETKLTLDHVPALSVEYRNSSNGGYETNVVYVISGLQTFSISFTANKPGVRLESLRNYPIFRQMLSTFKISH